jgi:hypothetical protein
VPVDAFFYDTAIDGYEWKMGFESQRGLIDRGRHPKPSLERLVGFSNRDAPGQPEP